MDGITELLTAKEAAALLRVSTIILAKWRAQKKGPSYIQTDGTIKYDRRALEGYMEQNAVSD